VIGNMSPRRQSGEALALNSNEKTPKRGLRGWAFD
jgi:hypothetical protein